MSIWHLVLGCALTFFVLIPGGGAVAVRRRWRRFRRAVVEASSLPTVTYARLAALRQGAGDAGGADSSGGRFRIFGRLEAIEDDDVIWLNDGTISVAADVADTVVYLLPARDQRRGSFPEVTPDRMPWRRLTTLPERTPVFVAGPLRLEGGRAVFRADGAEGLLLILYDAPDDELLEQAVWSGRQRNEYWNPLTPASLAVGSLALLLVAFVVLRIPSDRAAAIVAVTAALVPVLPLLPPGIFAFAVYRRMWRRGRFLRAERDLLRLPAGRDAAAEERARRAGRRARLLELAAVGSLLVGIGINFYGALLFVSRVIF